MLCLAAESSRASEAIPDPVPGPDYVVERVAALPEVTIRAMVQTRDGYLWMGTYNGLIRSDGVRAITFDVANTPALSSDSVYALHEDRSGNLWIGTDDGGVVRYRSGEFQAYGPEQGLTEVEVRAIAEDREHKLWVGTRQGLFYWMKDRFASLSATNALAKASIYVLVPAPDGSLWVGTAKGLFRLRDGNAEPVPELANAQIHGLAMDPHGVLWVAANSQRNFRIIPEPSGAKVEPLHPLRYGWYQTGRAGTFWLAGYTLPTRSLAGTLLRLEGLTNTVLMATFEHRKLSALCEDLEGNTWVGIESHGLYRIRRKQVRTISTDDGLPINGVTTVLEDPNGRVWLGTFGRSLFAADSETAKFQPIRIPGVPNITALLHGAEGTLSVGSYNGDIFTRHGTNFLPAKARGCRALYQDRDGSLWIGTLLNGVEHRPRLTQDGSPYPNAKTNRYTTRDGLASDRIQSLIQDPTGDMWIGTLRGLNRISAGKVVPFPGQHTLARQTIRALHRDSRGALWIGTLGGGLARFHNQQLRTITSRHGLPSDSIEQILEDDHGHLWLGTWAGIVRVDRDELDACADGRQTFIHAMTLGAEDGMLTSACGTGFQPSSMKARSGSLWFCTAAGLVIVDPKTVKPASQPPPVHIEEVTADDRSLPIQSQTLTVPPGVRRLSFHYTALSFSAPEKIRFRYRLEGYDDTRVSAGLARQVTYTRLPPGTYQFRISAINKDGQSTLRSTATEDGWNTTGALLQVIVIPPWWQTWWFRLTALACLTGALLGAYELRIHQHKKARTVQEHFARRLIQSQETERKRVAAELHDSLGQSLQVIKARAQLGLTAARVELGRTVPGEPSPQVGRGVPAEPSTLRSTPTEDGPSQTAKQFEEISTAATQAIREIRAISHALRPAELDQLGLANAIQWIVQQTDATSATTRFACELDLDRADRLPPELEITLYRIAQEAINNVLKHANATQAILQLHLERENGILRFSIFDNGRGLPKTVPPDRNGLIGIAERVRLLGGKFDIQSAPTKGTRLTVTIPTPPEPRPSTLRSTPTEDRSASVHPHET